MLSNGSGSKIQFANLEEISSITQANPVSGTQYEALATTTNVRILKIMCDVNWTVQPDPLEVHVIVDGLTWTFTQANPVTATPYFPTLSAGNTRTAQPMGTGAAYQLYQTYIFEGRSVRVTVESTGGTVQQVRCFVIYQRVH